VEAQELANEVEHPTPNIHCTFVCFFFFVFLVQEFNFPFQYWIAMGGLLCFSQTRLLRGGGEEEEELLRFRLGWSLERLRCFLRLLFGLERFPLPLGLSGLGLRLVLMLREELLCL